jgi:hypothetical protein
MVQVQVLHFARVPHISSQEEAVPRLHLRSLPPL